MKNTNAQDIVILQDENKADRVTKKEIFVRILRLELKMDEMWKENRSVRKQFKHYVYWLGILTVTDIVFSILIVYLHLKAL